MSNDNSDFSKEYHIFEKLGVIGGNRVHKGEVHDGYM